MDRASSLPSRKVTAIGVIAVLASLYFAKSLLLTLSIAVLVSLLLAPFASRLERWGLPRMGAVGIVVSLAFLLVALLGWSATRQVSDLAMKLPQYRANIAAKSAVLGPAGEYLLKGYATLEEISEEVLSSARSRTERRSSSESPKDKAVTTAQSPYQIMGGAFLTFLESLGNTVITVILVVFLLLYHSDIRDRLIHLFGDAQVHITTHTMSDAALSVSRYLLMQSVVNASYGFLVTVGLFALGIPNALLWGLAAALLRFIPYVGPWLGALMPLLLSLAVFDTWAPAVIFLSSLIILELLTANVAEPWLYGTKTGISPLAVILAAIFWSWLWGGMGLLLAIPLTVSLVSLAKSIPQLAFLNTLLGSETSILPKMQLYHRLLGRNEEEAVDLVEAHLKGSTLTETCDSLLVPALGLFEADRHHGDLDETKAEAVVDSVKRIVEDLAELPPPLASASAAATAPGAKIPILCLPSDDASDELAAFMLTRILTAAGYDARCLSAEATAGEKIEEIRKQEAEILCISALPPRALIPARYLYKRIRRECPDAEVVVGLWTAGGDPGPLKERIAEDGKIHLVTTFAEAAKRLQELATALALRKAASKDPQESSMAVQSRSETRP
jgi:predicted PurR-regulated permease PerM